MTGVTEGVRAMRLRWMESLETAAGLHNDGDGIGVRCCSDADLGLLASAWVELARLPAELDALLADAGDSAYR